jgi:homoserine O-acetyltransferase
MSTAWRSVQRRMVRFAIDCGRAQEGLQLARALAMSTYRSPEEFAALRRRTAYATERGFVFPVEDYLIARGADYATRYQPDGFLCLSESIDLHRVDAGRIFVPVTAVAVREDQLVPVPTCAPWSAPAARQAAGDFVGLWPRRLPQGSRGPEADLSPLPGPA